MPTRIGDSLGGVQGLSAVVDQIFRPRFIGGTPPPAPPPTPIDVKIIFISQQRETDLVVQKRSTDYFSTD